MYPPYIRQARYCSDDCRARSWHRYHQHECHSLDLLHSVGIAHLALRTVLVAGRKGILALRPYLKKDDSVSPSAGSALAGGQHGQYLRAVRLVHHADRLPKRELFMYAATAALLTMFVEQGRNSIDIKNLGPVFGPKLGQTFKDVSICFQ